MKMFGNKKEDRFEFIHKENPKTGWGLTNIMRDKETGVSYLLHSSGGLTPLLGKDGKPIIEPIEE